MFSFQLLKLSYFSGRRQFSNTTPINVRINRASSPASLPTLSRSKSSKQPTKFISNHSFTATLLRSNLKSKPTSPFYKEIFQAPTKQLVIALAQGFKLPSELLHKSLEHRKVNLKLFYLWIEILKSKNLIFGLTRLGLILSGDRNQGNLVNGTYQEEINRGENITGDKINSRFDDCPNWLFSYLPGLVKTQEDVPYIVSLLILDNLDKFKELNYRERIQFIASSLQAFLKVKHFIAVRELLVWFVAEDQNSLLGFEGLKEEKEELVDGKKSTYFPRQELAASSYARIFRSISQHPSRSGTYRAPPSDLLHPLVTLLNNSMLERNVSPTFETYNYQFSRALIPTDPKIASQLLLDMNSKGIKVEVIHLHAVMGVYSRAGDRVGARVLLETIKEAKLSGKILISEARVMKREKKLAGKATGGKKDSRINKKILEIREEKVLVKVLKEGVEENLKKGGGLGAEATLLTKSGVSRKEEPPIPDSTSKPVQPTLSSPSTRKSSSPAVDVLDRMTPYSTYHTTFLASSHSDPQAALDYFKHLRSTAPETVDITTWTTLLTIVCRFGSTTTTEVLDILTAFEKSHATRRMFSGSRSHRSRRLSRLYPDKPLPIKNYTLVFQSLLTKNAPAQILQIWEELKSRGLKPDSQLIHLISRAQFALGDIPSAMRLLHYYAYRPQYDLPLTSINSTSPYRPYRLRPTVDSVLASQRPQPHSVQLDMTNINALLVAYSRAGDYSEVYNLSLKSNLVNEFGIQDGIDLATLTILIDTARLASAAAGRGFGPGHQSTSSLTTQYSNIHGSDSFQSQDDNWGGIPAARYAEELVWEILEQGWPEGIEWVKRNDGLGGIELNNYVVNGMTGSNKNIFGWWSNMFSSSSSSSTTSTSSTSTQRIYFTATLGRSYPSPPSHPQIHPSPQLFSSLINLLGYHSKPQSIMRALTWMKYLNLIPTKKTLTIAIMYLGESGLGEKGRKKLNLWLMDWLGENSVPSEEEIARIRSGGVGGGGGGGGRK